MCPSEPTIGRDAREPGGSDSATELERRRGRGSRQTKHKALSHSSWISTLLLSWPCPHGPAVRSELWVQETDRQEVVNTATVTREMPRGTLRGRGTDCTWGRGFMGEMRVFRAERKPWGAGAAAQGSPGSPGSGWQWGQPT